MKPASSDPAKRAAETLYAFKTKASGGKLESAVSGATKEDEEGVLANSTTLETESEAQGHALIEPSGIAVDPATHDVIIMGWEDQEAKKEESQLRVALQRVSDNGVLGPRYVDKTNCFGGEGAGGGPIQELVEFPGAPHPAAGCGLSLVSEGARKRRRRV
jgi:hypothetical protein